MGFFITSGMYVPDLSGVTSTGFVLGILLSLSALSALFGDATPYSKFGNRKVDNIPSKKAMLVIYVPSAVIALLIQIPTFKWTTQFDILHFFTAFHFLKRVFEVLFVHIYKSTTNPEVMYSISIAYALTTCLDLLNVRSLPNNIYNSQLTNVGILCCVVGELLNGYHHWLLRQLRLNNDQKKDKYRLPKGGLFNYTLTPHYFTEQLTFLGLILIGQNVVTLSLRLFPFTYLTVRAYKTKLWYTSNLTNKSDKADLSTRKNLIPFVW